MIYPESLIKTIQLNCDKQDVSLIGSVSEAVQIYNDLNMTNFDPVDVFLYYIALCN